MAVERIRVEVVYALPETQQVVVVDLPTGGSLRHALERSRLLEALTPEECAQLSFGIFGEMTAPDALLADGDRVEIYRPLREDPKLIRRRRAALRPRRQRPR